MTLSDRHELIRRISQRAVLQYARMGYKVERISIVLDIDKASSCNENIDLDALMKFNDIDFIHDIAGINKYMDRNTGELKMFFLPRCARGTTESAPCRIRSG